MVRDLQSIIDQMRKFNTYHFRLSVKQDFNEVALCSTLEGKDKEKDVDPDQNIGLLTESVGYYHQDPNALFYIELYRTASSNGAGKTGKIKFVADSNTYKPTNQPGTTNPANNIPEAYINGLGAISQQSNSMFEERLGHIAKMSEERMQLERERNEIKMDRRELDREKKEFIETRDQTERDYQEKARLADSRAHQVSRGVEKGIETLIIKYLDAPAPLAPAALAGAQAETKPEERTVQETIIEDVAAYVYKNVTDVDELKVWRFITQQFVKEPHDLLFSEFRELIKQS